MSTMNISLPDTLKSFVDEQVSLRGYGASSEYVRDLIRKDQGRLQLRGLLLAGAESNPAAPTQADGQQPAQCPWVAVLSAPGKRPRRRLSGLSSPRGDIVISSKRFDG